MIRQFMPLMSNTNSSRASKQPPTIISSPLYSFLIILSNQPQVKLYQHVYDDKSEEEFDKPHFKSGLTPEHFRKCLHDI